MNITLEQIEELRKRVNVSYGDAKEALENSNGDMLEALIYLEKNHKFKQENAEGTFESLWDKLKALINKGNNTRFIIRKRDKDVINVTVTLTVIAAVLAMPVFLGGLLIALITGHKIRIEGNNGEDMKINDTLDKVSTAVTTAKRKLAETE